MKWKIILWGLIKPDKTRLFIMLICIPLIFIPTLYGIYNTLGMSIVRFENIDLIEPRNFYDDVLPPLITAIIFMILFYIIIGLKDIPPQKTRW